MTPFRVHCTSRYLRSASAFPKSASKQLLKENSAGLLGDTVLVRDRAGTMSHTVWHFHQTSEIPTGQRQREDELHPPNQGWGPSEYSPC